MNDQNEEDEREAKRPNIINKYEQQFCSHTWIEREVRNGPRRGLYYRCADIIGHAIYKPSKRKRACDRGQTFARYNVYR